jgi:mRNA interferase RelE/StbE
MKATFRKSFTRDLKKLKDKKVLGRVRAAIEEVESAETLQEITGLKKLTGPGHYYRIRLGDYRVGVTVEGNSVEFVRCLHRRDLYRFFP